MAFSLPSQVHLATPTYGVVQVWLWLLCCQVAQAFGVPQEGAFDSMIERAFHQLHSIRKMREIIRAWWRIELGFAYPDGYVADHELGVVIPSDNPFCRASLNSSEGFQACNRSIERPCWDSSRWGEGDPERWWSRPVILGSLFSLFPCFIEGHFLEHSSQAVF